jgi:hypothetical protein
MPDTAYPDFPPLPPVPDLLTLVLAALEAAAVRRVLQRTQHGGTAPPRPRLLGGRAAPEAPPHA